MRARFTSSFALVAVFACVACSSSGGSSLVGLGPEDLASGGGGSGSSSGQTDQGTVAPPDPMKSGVCAPDAQEPKCSAPNPIASADDLQNAIDALSYVDVVLGQGRVLRASNDLAVSGGAVELDSGNLTTPPECDPDVTKNANCAQPAFRLFAFPAPPPATATGSSVTGVSCATPGDATPSRGPTCAKIHVDDGTTFRLRAVVEDMGAQATPRYWPLIEVVPACASPCAAGQQRCGDTQTCFGGDFDYCAYCDGKDAKVCACQGACNVAKPEGAVCTFASAADSTTSGTCKTGVCSN